MYAHGLHKNLTVDSTKEDPISVHSYCGKNYCVPAKVVRGDDGMYLSTQYLNNALLLSWDYLTSKIREIIYLSDMEASQASSMMRYDTLNLVDLRMRQWCGRSEFEGITDRDECPCQA